MSRMAKAQAALIARQQKVHQGDATTIVYVRGAERIDLTGLAWHSNESLTRTVKDPAAASVTHGGRDYLIPVAALALNGCPWEPKKNDRIEETAAGVTIKFDVLPVLGEPAARYSDDGRTLWRVHAVQTKG
jgi:hypothetical protein